MSVAPAELKKRKIDVEEDGKAVQASSTTIKTTSVLSERENWGPASDISHHTINPIRAIVDNLKIPPNQQDKKLIPLSIGDPAVFGNLPPPPSTSAAIQKALQSGKYNGYCPSTGLLVAREAIAKRFSEPNAKISSNDVVIASGCSGALTLAIQALCSVGDNVLLPRPGFSIYATIAGHSSINTKFYNLDPRKHWEVDLEHLESMIDAKTRAIVVLNPSNPTGSNYSAEHLIQILEIAEAHCLPIIADEIYANIVYKGQVFHSMAALSTEVPILSCKGIAKQYLIPGWRLGWVEVHERRNRLPEVREALQRLSQLILGASTIIQAALPDIFENTPASYYQDLNDKLEEQANVVITELSKVKSLNLIPPQGAMYLLVEVIPENFVDINNETEFAQKLLEEELVFVLPGTCFGAEGFIRIVICPPIPMLQEACARIAAFCTRHQSSKVTLVEQNN